MDRVTGLFDNEREMGAEIKRDPEHVSHVSCLMGFAGWLPKRHLLPMEWLAGLNARGGLIITSSLAPVYFLNNSPNLPIPSHET